MGHYLIIPNVSACVPAAIGAEGLAILIDHYSK